LARRRCGAVPEALRPIFRDREDFTAGETLPEQTLAALDASSALIVVCSPDSARSNYVNEETRLFKARHPARPVIPLIVGGKPGDPERECFAPTLKFNLDPKGRVTKKRVELLAADPRDEGDGKELALAKVIARLLGLSSDEVFRRAERERRGAARRRRSIQFGFGALVVIGAALGGLLYYQSDLKNKKVLPILSLHVRCDAPDDVVVQQIDRFMGELEPHERQLVFATVDFDKTCGACGCEFFTREDRAADPQLKIEQTDSQIIFEFHDVTWNRFQMPTERSIPNAAGYLTTEYMAYVSYQGPFIAQYHFATGHESGGLGVPADLATASDRAECTMKTHGKAWWQRLLVVC
jgi:hypothetical protein